MRKLILNGRSGWKAERPDRDAPDRVVVDEAELALDTHAGSGITNLFNELEKMAAKRKENAQPEVSVPVSMSPAKCNGLFVMETPTADGCDERSKDPSPIHQCEVALLEMQVTICRLLNQLRELDQPKGGK